MFKNLIAGEWTPGTRVSRIINRSGTRDLVGEYAQADAAQTRAAIAAAQAAFPSWSLSTPQQRFDILDTAGSEILARRAELGDLSWMARSLRRTWNTWASPRPRAAPWPPAAKPFSTTPTASPATS